MRPHIILSVCVDVDIISRRPFLAVDMVEAQSVGQATYAVTVCEVYSDAYSCIQSHVVHPTT